MHSFDGHDSQTINTRETKGSFLSLEDMAAMRSAAQSVGMTRTDNDTASIGSVAPFDLVFAPKKRLAENALYPAFNALQAPYKLHLGRQGSRQLQPLRHLPSRASRSQLDRPGMRYGASLTTVARQIRRERVLTASMGLERQLSVQGAQLQFPGRAQTAN